MTLVQLAEYMTRHGTKLQRTLGVSLKAVYIGENQARLLRQDRDARLHLQMQFVAPAPPEDPWLVYMGVPIYKVSTKDHLSHSFDNPHD